MCTVSSDVCTASSDVCTGIVVMYVKLGTSSKTTHITKLSTIITLLCLGLIVGFC